MLDYARERGIGMTREVAEGAAPTIAAAMRALSASGVLERYDGGVEPVYYVTQTGRHAASYYRNTVIHFLVGRAIAELAGRAAAAGRAELSGERDPRAFALRLRELLKFEFFFSEREPFLREMEREWQLLARERAAKQPELLAACPRILLDFLESYWVVGETLRRLPTSGATPNGEVLRRCHQIGRQLLLQDRVQSPELLSNLTFANALRLLENLGAAQRAARRLRAGQRRAPRRARARPRAPDPGGAHLRRAEQARKRGRGASRSAGSPRRSRATKGGAAMPRRAPLRRRGGSTGAGSPPSPVRLCPRLPLIVHCGKAIRNFTSLIGNTARDLSPDPEAGTRRTGRLRRAETLSASAASTPRSSRSSTRRRIQPVPGTSGRKRMRPGDSRSGSVGIEADLAGVIPDGRARHEPVAHAPGRLEGGDLLLERHAARADHADRAEPVRRGVALLAQHDLLHPGPALPAHVVDVEREHLLRRGRDLLRELDLHWTAILACGIDTATKGER